VSVSAGFRCRQRGASTRYLFARSRPAGPAARSVYTHYVYTERSILTRRCVKNRATGPTRRRRQGCACAEGDSIAIGGSIVEHRDHHVSGIIDGCPTTRESRGNRAGRAIARSQQRAQTLRLCRNGRFDGAPPIRHFSRYSTPRLRKDSSLPEEFARSEMWPCVTRDGR